LSLLFVILFIVSSPLVGCFLILCALGFDLSAFVGQPQHKRRDSLEVENFLLPKSLQLKQSKPLGIYLKFLNREKSINQLLVHTEEQYKFYKNGYGDKDFKFATCSGGPGLGKVMSQFGFQSLSFGFNVVSPDNFLPKGFLKSCR
jgi:hypothetical protein